MFKQLNFPILLIHPAIGQNNVAGRQLEALFQALDEEGFEVLGAEHLEEGRLIAEAHRGLSCRQGVTSRWTSRGQRQRRSTFSATDPKSMRSRPEAPWVVMATRPTPPWSAASRIPAAALCAMGLGALWSGYISMRIHRPTGGGADSRRDSERMDAYLREQRGWE